MALTDEDKKWIKDELEATETRLLIAFHKWASPMETRIRSHTAVLRAVDLDAEALAERVGVLETKAS